MTRRIIQFGASRFLQAHLDLFVHEARCSGQDIGDHRRNAGGSAAPPGAVSAIELLQPGVALTLGCR